MHFKFLNWGLFFFLTLATGCTPFHHEWRKAGRSHNSSAPYVGQWEGEWISARNGHHGKLRCLLGENSMGTEFRAHFRATYAKVLHFSYVANLTGSQTDNTIRFTGESDLGKLAGGVYKYSGTANATHFSCTYESKYDHGTFQMSRSK